MEKGRIEFDDPLFRPSDEELKRMKKRQKIPTALPKGAKNFMRKLNDDLKWKRIANDDFPPDKQ